HIDAQKKIVVADRAAVDAPMQRPRGRSKVRDAVLTLEPIGHIVSLIQDKVAEFRLTQTRMSFTELDQKSGEQEKAVLAGGIQVSTVVVMIGAGTQSRNSRRRWRRDHVEVQPHANAVDLVWIVVSVLS